MQQHVRHVKSPRVCVPEKVIDHVGDVLDRPVMGRERVDKQIVPKRFQNEERALDKRIVAREVIIVPNAFTLEGWRVNDDRGDRQTNHAQPIPAQIILQSHSLRDSCSTENIPKGEVGYFRTEASDG